MSSTLSAPSSSDPLLNPNTRAEAEAALHHNASYQTSSAGRPQPTNLLSTSPSGSGYLAACRASGITCSGIPHPIDTPVPTLQKEGTSSSVDSVEVGKGDDLFYTYNVGDRQPLTRGVTATILQKMDSGDYNFGDSTSSLGRRASREGERRTSLATVKSRESGRGDASGAEPKPGLQRHQSWRQEDLKHSYMQQQYMQVPEPSHYGYSSTGGTPMYTGSPVYTG